MSKYVWQKQNKANRNHYILEIHDTLNPSNSAIFSTYYDGTQSAAISFFTSLDKVHKYMDSERYAVTMRANSIVLNWKD